MLNNKGQAQQDQEAMRNTPATQIKAQQSTSGFAGASGVLRVRHHRTTATSTGPEDPKLTSKPSPRPFLEMTHLGQRESVGLHRLAFR